MSTGLRLPLATARAAANHAMERWGMLGTGMVVGSIRRGRPDVGDIELVAPLEDKKRDTLYDRISATMRPETDSIFGAASMGGEPLGYPVQGLKPGFKMCSVILTGQGGQEIGCQVFRYTPQNKGWITLMRTGPGELGEWFLAEWKKRHRIPREKPASVEGHLVNGAGEIVPVESEEACFTFCGLGYVPPEKRDGWMEAKR